MHLPEVDAGVHGLTHGTFAAICQNVPVAANACKGVPRAVKLGHWSAGSARRGECR